MANIESYGGARKLSYAERNLCSRRREALLYVAGRFMAVHIDRCGKLRRKRAS